jgi:hypothetical protein
MARIANVDMGDAVSSLTPFENNNGSAFGRDVDDMYVAYSWGTHFPMYVYDYASRSWFGNDDKYSRSTSKHQTYARPDVADISWVDTDYLTDMVRSGSYAAHCARRCITPAA